MKILAIVILFLGFASAQDFSLAAGGSVAAAGDLGYSNPTLGVFANSRFVYGHWAISSNAKFDFREKKSFAKRGHGYGEEAYGGFIFKRVEFDAGVVWAKQINEQYQKAILSPELRVAYILPGVPSITGNVYGRAIFPDQLSQNHTRGVGGGLEFFLPHHIYAKGELIGYRYDQIVPNQPQIRYSAHTGAKLEIQVGWHR